MEFLKWVENSKKYGCVEEQGVNHQGPCMHVEKLDLIPGTKGKSLKAGDMEPAGECRSSSGVSGDETCRVRIGQSKKADVE